MKRIIKNILHKISVALRMIKIYKNWPRLVAYRLNLMPAAMVVEVRDHSRFKVRDRRLELSDAYVINESYLYGIHDLILPYLRTAKVGIDVGAHIGSFTIFAAKRSPARIFAIEAAPNNFRVLEENIALNNLEDRITPLPLAVAGRSGLIDLFLPQNSGLTTTIKNHLTLYSADDGPIEKIVVPALTLAEIFRQNAIDFCDFLKMDVEGGEYDILYHTPRAIFNKIKVMTIECHKDGDINALMQFLRNHGFEVERPTMEFAEVFCRNRSFA